MPLGRHSCNELVTCRFASNFFLFSGSGFWCSIMFSKTCCSKFSNGSHQGRNLTINIINLHKLAHLVREKSWPVWLDLLWNPEQERFRLNLLKSEPAYHPRNRCASKRCIPFLRKRWFQAVVRSKQQDNKPATSPWDTNRHSWNVSMLNLWQNPFASPLRRLWFKHVGFCWFSMVDGRSMALLEPKYADSMSNNLKESSWDFVSGSWEFLFFTCWFI